MKRFDPQALCLSLMLANSEKEVEDILGSHRLLDNPKYWRDLGDTASNSSIVGAQQAEPDFALVEKITNAMDAILLAKVKLSGIDPESDNAPQTIREAASKFVFGQDAKAYSLNDVPAELLREVSSNITLVASGSKRLPTLTITDNGEGQAPDAMPFTLLSLPVKASYKRKIPFVQGKFNMGGTGVLRFAGQFGTQFIISKRHPGLVDDQSNNPWGFTVVRRFYSNDRLSVYRYLAPAWC